MVTASTSTQRVSLSCRLIVGICTALSAGSMQAATILKADNVDALNLTSSWAGGVIPGPLDVGSWNSTLTGANTVALGADLSLRGLAVSNPGGAVTLSAGNLLTLGTDGIDLSTATQNLSIAAGLTLGGGGQTWNVATGRTLAVSGALTRTNGSTLLVDRSTNTGTVTASPTLLNGMTPWVTTRSAGTAANSAAAGYNFATVTSGNVVPFTAATALTAAGAWGGTPSGGTGVANYDVSGAFAATGLQRHFNSLRYTGSAAVVQPTNNSNFIALLINSLMNSGTGTVTIGTPTLGFVAAISPTTATHHLDLAAANNSIIFDTTGRITNAGSTMASGVITNGATAGAVSITGPGTVEMRGQAVHTGATYVNSGTLHVSNAGTWNNTSSINVNGSGAKYLHTSTVASTRTIALTRGTVDGTGTLGTVNVADSSDASLTHGNGGTNTLTIGTLTFSGDAAVTARRGASGTPLSVTGALSTTPANGQVVLHAPATSWAIGLNNLVSYGSFSGSISDFTLGTVSGLNSRQSAGSLQLNGNNIALNIIGDSPKWTGLDSAQWVIGSTGASSNWKLSTAGSATNYIEGDQALFDDTATGSSAVQIDTASVSPASVEFNNSTKNYSLASTGAFGIAGATGLIKNGTGTLTISNANSYSGATILNTGTLVLENTTALGSGALTLNGGSLDTLTADLTLSTAKAQTWAGDFSFTGTRNLSFNGGVATLTGAGSRTVTLGNGATLGTGRITSASTGLTLAGTGTLAITTNVASSISGTLEVGANAILRINTGADAGTTQDFTATGLAGSGIIENGGGIERWFFINTTGTHSFSGILRNGSTGALGFNKQGTGSVTLAGNNSFTGVTTFAGGSLILAHPNALSTTSNVAITTTGLTMTFASDTSINAVPFNTATGHTQNFVSDRATPGAGINHNLTTPAALGIGGTTLNFTSGANVTSGIGSFTFTQLGMSSGTGGAQVVLNPTTANVTVGSLFKVLNNASPVVVLSGTSTGNQVTGVISNGAILVAPNALSIIKSSSSTWTLSGANTYTGTTAVNEGTLVINGSHTGTGATTVGGASAIGTPVLTGSGTLAGPLTISATTTVGTLNPGTVGGIGTFTAGSTVIAGHLNIDLDAATSDKLAVVGDLDISAGTLNVSGTASAASYVIASYTGTITGAAFASYGAGLPSGYVLNINTTAKEVQLVNNADTDSDGLPDAWELAHFGNITSQTGATDADSDGFTNLQEYTAGTSPANAAFTPNDTDGDGLGDAWEVTHFGNIGAGNPTADPDNDKCTNLQEFTGGQTNPNDRNSFPDVDADGLPDGWEVFYFTNTTSQNGSGDPDSDTFTNLAEFTANTSPTDPVFNPNDTDGDSMTDAWETTHFGNLTTAVASHDPDADFNTNLQEAQANTNPKSRSSFPDTDTDGMADGWETHYFSNLSAAATADADADGASNLDEFLANSSPSDVAWTPTKAKIANRWSFTNNLSDSVGTSQATIVDPDNGVTTLPVTQNATTVTLAGGARATADFVNLGSNLLAGRRTPVTVELWATQDTVKNWSRIFDFGSGSNTDEYVFMAWTQGTNAATDMVEWKDGGVTTNSPNTNQPYTLGTQYHIILTLEPGMGASGTSRVSWYRAAAVTQPGAGTPETDMGAQRGTFNTTITLEQFVDAACWLGRSQWPDETANATYDEVRIWNGSLTTGEREALHDVGPDVINLDSDSDGLPDTWETTHFGSIAAYDGSADPDGDLYNNSAEYTANTNPTQRLASPDSDGDGLTDGYEVHWFKLVGETLAQALAHYTGSDDPDSDGYTNAQEKAAITGSTVNTGLANEDVGTNPSSAASNPGDLDSDGLLDAWEIHYFTSISAHSGSADPDGDGATNAQEHSAASNPNSIASTPTDTDGNGTPDSTINFMPYTADADTLHLYHMDSFIPTVPDLGTNPIPLLALEGSATLAEQGLGNFRRVLNTFPGANTTGNAARLGAKAGGNSASGTDNSVVTLTGASGAFTLEALIQPLFDPSIAQHNQNIIAYDDEGSTGRVFQFRISYNGTQPRLEFANILGQTTTQNMFADIPVAGTHGIMQNKWYHLAVSYDGNEGVVGNIKFYWTVADGTQTRANTIIMTAASSGTVGAMTSDLISPVAGSDFTIGNRGRATETENFMGNIDEVRVSAVARAAVGGFGFVPAPAAAAPTTLAATAANPNINLTWANTNTAGTAASIRVERSETSGSGFIEIASLSGSATNYSDTTPVLGTPYFYRVRAVNLDDVASAYSSEATATVMNAPISSWRLANFGTTSNTGTAADTFDADGDGLANLMEYAMGTNPNTNSAAPTPPTRGATEFTLDFTTADSATDITVTVEANTDLAPTWSSAGVTYSVLGSAGGLTTRRAHIPAPGSEVRRFARVRVTRNP